MTPGNPRAKVSSPLSKSAIEEVSCDICHGSDFRIVAQPTSLYSQDRYRVVQCRRCDLVFVNPRARSFEAEYEANGNAVTYFVNKERHDLDPFGPYHAIAAQLSRAWGIAVARA